MSGDDTQKPPITIKLHPDPDEYQEAETKFFYTLGICVNRWAFVDRRLFRLFQWALRSQLKPTATLYYKPKTIQMRLQLVQDLLECRLADDVYSGQWRPLWKRVDALIPTRNIFVHHPAMRLGTSKAGKAVYHYAIRIEPNERVLGKNYPGLLGKEHLLIEDLETHAFAVDQLEIDLRRFHSILVQ